MKKWILILPFVLCLNGCFPPAVWIAGAVIGVTGSVIYDKRSVQTIWNDRKISDKAEGILENDPSLKKNTNISAATFDGNVLLVGQAQTAQLREQAEKKIETIKGVRKIYNEVAIAAPDQNLQGTSDSWITTKVKTELLSKKGFKSFELKVVTDNGVVYLMGRTTEQKGDQVADIVRRVSGVNKVVKVFEYTNHA
jgi:osmotically-inducible protein OsmY